MNSISAHSLSIVGGRELLIAAVGCGGGKGGAEAAKLSSR